MSRSPAAQVAGPIPASGSNQLRTMIMSQDR